jgi:hypothetical protein
MRQQPRRYRDLYISEKIFKLDMTIGAKLLYALLKSYPSFENENIWGSVGVWADRKHLAEMLQYKNSDQITKKLKELKDAGLIEFGQPFRMPNGAVRRPIRPRLKKRGRPRLKKRGRSKSVTSVTVSSSKSCLTKVKQQAHTEPGSNKKKKKRRNFKNTPKPKTRRLSPNEQYSLKLIQKWNDSTLTRTHRIDQPFSKTAAQLIKWLTELQEGRFADDKSFNEAWRIDNGIRERAFSVEYSRPALNLAIENLIYHLHEDRWPRNAQTFRSLHNCVYNAHANRSWIIRALVKGKPGKLNSKVKNVNQVKILRRLQDEGLIPKSASPMDLDLTASAIKKEFIQELKDNSIGEKYHNSTTFLRAYVDWLDVNIKKELKNIYAIRPEGWAFNKFITYLHGEKE